MIRFLATSFLAIVSTLLIVFSTFVIASMLKTNKLRRAIRKKERARLARLRRLKRLGF